MGIWLFFLEEKENSGPMRPKYDDKISLVS